MAGYRRAAAIILIPILTLAVLLVLLVKFGRRTPRGRVDRGRPDTEVPMPLPLPMPDADSGFGTAIADDQAFDAGGGSFGGGGASGDWDDDSDSSSGDSQNYKLVIAPLKS